jgi:hypothetical protein
MKNRPEKFIPQWQHHPHLGGAIWKPNCPSLCDRSYWPNSLCLLGVVEENEVEPNFQYKNLIQRKWPTRSTKMLENTVLTPFGHQRIEGGEGQWKARVRQRGAGREGSRCPKLKKVTESELWIFTLQAAIIATSRYTPARCYTQDYWTWRTADLTAVSTSGHLFSRRFTSVGPGSLSASRIRSLLNRWIICTG